MPETSGRRSPAGRRARGDATRDYRVRRAKEQRTNKDVMRCLKRYIAREVHRALMADLTAPSPT